METTSPWELVSRNLRIGERAGLPTVHAHMQRHGCGYALANAGQDKRAIQDCSAIGPSNHRSLHRAQPGSLPGFLARLSAIDRRLFDSARKVSKSRREVFSHSFGEF